MNRVIDNRENKVDISKLKVGEFYLNNKQELCMKLGYCSSVRIANGEASTFKEYENAKVIPVNVTLSVDSERPPYLYKD